MAPKGKPRRWLRLAQKRIGFVGGGSRVIYRYPETENNSGERQRIACQKRIAFELRSAGLSGFIVNSLDVELLCRARCGGIVRENFCDFLQHDLAEGVDPEKSPFADARG